jgi:hypothetical protein
MHPWVWGRIMMRLYGVQSTQSVRADDEPETRPIIGEEGSTPRLTTTERRLKPRTYPESRPRLGFTGASKKFCPSSFSGGTRQARPRLAASAPASRKAQFQGSLGLRLRVAWARTVPAPGQPRHRGPRFGVQVSAPRREAGQAGPQTRKSPARRIGTPIPGSRPIVKRPVSCFRFPADRESGIGKSPKKPGKQGIRLPIPE